MIALDFDPLVYRDMQEVAEMTSGTLGLTRDGRVMVLVGSKGTAATWAESLNEADVFPHGYLKAESNRFGLPPFDYITFEF